MEIVGMMGRGVLAVVDMVARMAFWTNRAHDWAALGGTSGPAVGRRSKRVWVALDRYWASVLCAGAVVVFGALVWLLYFAA